jgi:hypothetical protein
VKSSGGSQAHISVHVGQDWYTHLCIYDDRPPILDISAGSVMAALSIADRQVGPSAVEFARELASQAAKFAAEVERHRARQLDCEPEATGSSAAGAGEAA